MDFKLSTLDALLEKMSIDGLFDFVSQIKAGITIKPKNEEDDTPPSECTIENHVLAEFVRMAIINAGIEQLPSLPTQWMVYDSISTEPPTIEASNGTLPRLVGVVAPREANATAATFNNGSGYVHGVTRNLELVTDGRVTASIFRRVLDETKKVQRVVSTTAGDEHMADAN